MDEACLPDFGLNNQRCFFWAGQKKGTAHILMQKRRFNGLDRLSI
jgi:hypothetical protein